ncbi:hypothetical protein GCM10010512_44900 [Streptomyces thermoviolaceus subsp. thermoviolaceus]|uniref:HNH endonuclease n=1 Tax=Streptomyces thermoviolaceus subsp. thermoviolaceus TaxID=66860 RepID=A0ABX0YWB0_STRTL|nr:hypothetical protein [Streptomyces thermoviolaceus]NJP16327.1 hypothetical protein [Streptomyces thermoviolaceus subsp. thermoviolaceus]WTD48947.1 hypothetical protein OG899_16360 [Streptomyces thermoviolaceus]GHB08361.1 hypothetical protein GCM10010512_44900 [Streptomyces thermoviolaceus subsp. thermoviolaceus]
MTKTIPPTREKARRQLEKRADEILATAGEPTSEGWPQTWHPDREETEHDRIAVAHKGVHSLREAALFCMFPSYGPQEERGKISELMTQKPGADTEDVETVLATEGGFHKSGKEQPKREVWERCRWLGCGKSLYSPEKPRKRGNPRKYCDRHKRAARTRTERLRYKGIWVGKHRNLSYIEDHPSPIHEWFRPLLEDCYQANRDCWLPLNVPGGM